MTQEKLPVIELSGTPRERGLQYGKILKDRIIKVIKVYERVFKEQDKTFAQLGMLYKPKIAAFNPEYVEEIEAIAQGAKVDPGLIYAVNARTEILSLESQPYSECTAVYFKQAHLLGQNWDWGGDLEKLMVLLRIRKPDGHTILTMTEPGMLAKVGLNNAGVGLCLSALDVYKNLYGVPIHIILRSILDAKSRDEVILNIASGVKHGGYETAGNILAAFEDGSYLNVELADDKMFFLEPNKEIFVHTNHYLGAPLTDPALKRHQSTFARYKRAQELIPTLKSESIDDMKRLLADNKGKLPIQRPIIPDKLFGIYGTNCSLIIDLNKKLMHITKGNPIENPYTTIPLEN